MTGFTGRAVRAEALRDLAAAPVRVAVAVVVALLLGGGVVLWSGAEVRSVEAAWQARRVAGAFVWEVRAGTTGGLSAARCDALRAVDGVVASGGVLTMTQLTPVTAPGRTVAVRTATPGFAAVVWPEEPGAARGSVMVGQVAAEELGWQIGARAVAQDVTATDRLSAPVDLAAGASARLEGFERSVVVAVPALGTVPECLVEAEPGAVSAVGALLAGWFDPADEVVTVPLRPDGALDRDPDAELRGRASRWAGPAAGLALVGFSVVLWWARRTDVAVYRMLGMRRGQVLVAVLLDSTATVLVPSQMGVAVALGWLGAEGEVSAAVARAVLVDDLRLLLVLAVCPLVGTLAATSLVAWDALRGR